MLTDLFCFENFSVFKISFINISLQGRFNKALERMHSPITLDQYMTNFCRKSFHLQNTINLTGPFLTLSEDLQYLDTRLVIRSSTTRRLCKTA